MKIHKAKYLLTTDLIARYSTLTLWKSSDADPSLFTHWSLTVPCGHDFYSENWDYVSKHLTKEHDLYIGREEIIQIVRQKIIQQRLDVPSMDAWLF